MFKNAGRIGNIKHNTLFYTDAMLSCGGANVQFGIKKVYAGESKTFPGSKEFMESHDVNVIDLDLDECKNLMNDFIRNNPKLWNEDIGEL